MNYYKTIQNGQLKFKIAIFKNRNKSITEGINEKVENMGLVECKVNIFKRVLVFLENKCECNFTLKIFKIVQKNKQ